MSGDEERLRAELDHMAGLRHAIVYTHPHYSLFSVHWDVLNYDKVNRYPFGQWVKAPRWPRARAELRCTIIIRSGGTRARSIRAALGRFIGTT